MPLMTLPEAEKRQILAALEVTNWRIYGPRGSGSVVGHRPGKAAVSNAQVRAETTKRYLINASP